MAFAAAPLPPIGIIIEPETAATGLFSTGRSDNPSLSATRLLAGRKLAAAYGSVALTGQDATLTENAAETPVYAAPLPSLSMFALGDATSIVMQAEYVLFATNRSDNLSIAATNLRKGRRLTASVGTFGAEGAPAERDMEMNADPRLFQLLGQDASITIGQRSVTCAFGSYAMDGQDASFIIESTGVRTLPAEVGRFATNRSDNQSLTSTTMVRAYRLTSDYGDYVLNGKAASLTGPKWSPVSDGAGEWVFVTPSGGVWVDVDPDS